MQPRDREAAIALLSVSDPWKRLNYTVDFWQRVFAPIPHGRDSVIIERAGEVAGIAMVRPNFLFGDYLELLAIAPAQTGQGLGVLLLAHVESLVFHRAKNLFACVSDFNEGARRFYRRQGFEEIGPLHDLIIRGSAELLLRKSMGPARSTMK
jgi:ribosomal protein S18 acetylase RimI-like enzyme